MTKKKEKSITEEAISIEEFAAMKEAEISNLVKYNKRLSKEIKELKNQLKESLKPKPSGKSFHHG